MRSSPVSCNWMDQMQTCYATWIATRQCMDGAGTRATRQGQPKKSSPQCDWYAPTTSARLRARQYEKMIDEQRFWFPPTISARLTVTQSWGKECSWWCHVAGPEITTVREGTEEKNVTSRGPHPRTLNQQHRMSAGSSIPLKSTYFDLNFNSDPNYFLSRKNNTNFISCPYSCSIFLSHRKNINFSSYPNFGSNFILSHKKAQTFGW